GERGAFPATSFMPDDFGPRRRRAQSRVVRGTIIDDDDRRVSARCRDDTADGRRLVVRRNRDDDVHGHSTGATPTTSATSDPPRARPWTNAGASRAAATTLSGPSADV